MLGGTFGFDFVDASWTAVRVDGSGICQNVGKPLQVPVSWIFSKYTLNKTSQGWAEHELSVGEQEHILCSEKRLLLRTSPLRFDMQEFISMCKHPRNILRSPLSTCCTPPSAPSQTDGNNHLSDDSLVDLAVRDCSWHLPISHFSNPSSSSSSQKSTMQAFAAAVDSSRAEGLCS
jgi:hypothetical protein